jgi:chemotaxis protein MotB
MMRRRRRSDAHSNHERWLVSYADFITLLFAFFVVLYSSSRADQKKQAMVSRAIHSGFKSLGLFNVPALNSTDISNIAVSGKGSSQGIESSDRNSSPVIVVMGEHVMCPARVKKDLDQVRHDMEKMLSNQIADHTVSIKMGKDGLVISLREAGFFSSGSATPHPETLPILREIAATLSGTPYDLSIEGHTDNLPIHNAAFDSNWELSSARSTRLARIFIATGDIAPQRIAAAGYGEFRPVSSNATAAGRAENRRVDLVVKPQTTTDLNMPLGDSRNSSWQKIDQ